MAQIRIHEINTRIENEKEVQLFLQKEDVLYEKWDISKLPAHLQNNYALTDENKEEILTLFSNEIADVSQRRGYKAHDIISLSSATPNLDELLINFKQEHHHTDDEVRFIVSGHGIFAIQGKDGRFFDVELEPGDLISVPENVRHYFTLQDDRQVVAIRIFVTTAGWVPIY
ncbi:1,2-dihydroxy-3-keto-5-methylthiopentene dioxygenase [Bacillus cytotoxicus]|uniref:Acireductone dioxygenase n=2 Tax=Bacillus cytotoxicus TaxID=580165 RepID=MTND_BACCN|nr:MULTISPECIES: cupin domain-containing protein [Bacillus cereus group]A7GS63.1 RecName: Full=Acireductone dioxygenase; AltName: Full=1,2-dihydroxy-3-keto-5-methylthiopentene dioxygenase; Short=DHK-MTPene dioxygenase; AltName: Full=Acireductone dioxygenase (Fe(2+)-requiring); Short=ARD'; Short=Fe-ARD; AltName: Full=Acireductone dioxygenase (Ni(2+)-requiring); Short=ARD; Short=Ni-ARD [Bacillus cytotoxicus NVH 391-98]ABS22971.1 Acireductone dioxygenase ARD [Bacillus cytotoxicus NVH 391-98]AWC2962